MVILNLSKLNLFKYLSFKSPYVIKIYNLFL
nr:MAG TPA: hypothetical protein [Caudoviricetes sp.]DAQ72283.1 MAG TPA: hypothetical protein [Caudoviricetes sp.]